MFLRQLTIKCFRKDARHSLQTGLQMNVPDPQNFVLGKAHELSAGMYKADPNHAGHVTAKHLQPRPTVHVNMMRTKC